MVRIFRVFLSASIPLRFFLTALIRCALDADVTHVTFYPLVSLFGFISLGLIPIPLIFIRYGPTFRARSHFASEARRVAEEMRGQHTAVVERANDEDTEKKDDVEAQQVPVVQELDAMTPSTSTAGEKTL